MTELNTEEQTNFVTVLKHEFTEYNGIFPIVARNRYPCKDISKNVNYDIEDVELHDIRCGRFGLPLKFNNTVPVHCNEELCNNMCLSLNATTYHFYQTIDTCSHYVISKMKNTFLHETRCPSGYYRPEIDYVEMGKNFDACFSIQMFPEPIPVRDLENLNVVESYCNGTIMTLNWGDDLFVFKQLSEQLGLTNEDRCLFGILSNEIVQYSDWDEIDVSEINLFNFNWDKSMNYSRIRDEDSYLAVQPNGKWTWAVDTVTCIACMANSPIPTPTLRLTQNIFENKLELEVTHQEFLYRENSWDPGFICFSIFHDIYKANLAIFPLPNTVGKYFLEDDGLAQYWCNGHTLLKRQYVSSEQLLAYGIWFIFQIDRKCDIDCSFTANDLDRFVDSFKRNNGFVSVRNSGFVGLETVESNKEYSFIVKMSLRLNNKITDKLVTNLVNLTDHQLETVYIYEQLKKTMDDEFNIKSIRSTEYCLHQSILSINATIWGIAEVGDMVSTSPLCPNKIITRTCAGDDEHGAYWEEPVDTTHCHTTVSQSLLNLYIDISKSYRIAEVLEDVKNLLQRYIEILLPIDVFLTSLIVQEVHNVTVDDFENTYLIYNYLMQIDERFLKNSAYLNSTNILLEAFETILLSHFELSIADSNNFLQYGNVTIRSPLIETHIFYPDVSDFSGLALYRPRGSADVDFSIYSIRYIYGNDSIVELMTELSDRNLIVGSYIPKGTRNTLKNITAVLTIFFNDNLFQSIEETSEQKFIETNGKIFSIKILGLSDSSYLENKMKVLFESSSRTDNSTCGYWRFSSTNSWSSDGCDLREIFVNDYQRLAVCECSHLGYLSYLVESEFVEFQDNTLAIITHLSASLSLVGSFGIFLTAVMFQGWRHEVSSKIRINFAASITLQTLLNILINFKYGLLSCVALGLILHYSVLVMFFWMLIIVYFQFNHFVVVFNFNVSNLLLKLAIFVWGFPLLPLLTVLSVDQSLYNSTNKHEHKFCYPSGWSLYFGVLAPIGLIFVVVSIVIISVLTDLHRKSKNAINKMEASKFRVGLSQVRLSALLFSTLVLTWLFGFFSRIFFDSVYLYLFCVMSTIKGVVLFLYFIAFDQRVRSFWVNYFSKLSCPKFLK